MKRNEKKNKFSLWFISRGHFFVVCVFVSFLCYLHHSQYPFANFRCTQNETSTSICLSLLFYNSPVGYGMICVCIVQREIWLCVCVCFFYFTLFAWETLLFGNFPRLVDRFRFSRVFGCPFSPTEICVFAATQQQIWKHICCYITALVCFPFRACSARCGHLRSTDIIEIKYHTHLHTHTFTHKNDGRTTPFRIWSKKRKKVRLWELKKKKIAKSWFFMRTLYVRF